MPTVIVSPVYSPKRLVVDLAALPDRALPRPRAPQPSRLLDNYEGLALGPRLPDGRTVLTSSLVVG